MNRKCGAVPSRQVSSDWGARQIALAVVLLLLCGFRLAAAENYEITVRRNVPVKMRDGVTLQADIYRPKANGKFPVLLVRTPYDKTQEMEFAVKAATRGYVVVAQDVRGRYASEGDWYPFKNESQDGYDTVEWAAALPYSNGKVGMFGGPYVGATQYLAASRVMELKFTKPLERFRTVTVDLLEGILGTDQQALKPWTLTFEVGGS